MGIERLCKRLKNELGPWGGGTPEAQKRLDSRRAEALAGRVELTGLEADQLAEIVMYALGVRHCHRKGGTATEKRAVLQWLFEALDAADTALTDDGRS